MLNRYASAIPFLSLQPFLAADDGKQAGAASDDSEPDAGTPGGQQGGEDTGEESGGDDDRTKPSGKTYTAEQVEGIVESRLAREREKLARDAEKARREAETKAAEEQGEWQKLAESHAERITELEPLESQLEAATEQSDRYKAALESMLESERAELPEHITALLDRLDPVDQIEWISQHRETINAAKQAPKNGVPPAPKAGDGRMTEDERRRLAFKTRL